MALEIKKKSLLVWKFIDTVNIKEFIPSRFSVNTLDNTVTVVYKDGANSQTYNLADIELYDLGSISPFPTFVTIEAFMLKLEQMNCPCFPEISVIGGVQSVVAGTNVSVNNTDPLNPIVSASGGSSSWGGITGTLSDQTDLQDALNNKLEKVDTNDGIEKVYVKNANGTQSMKPISELITNPLIWSYIYSENNAGYSGTTGRLVVHQIEIPPEIVLEENTLIEIDFFAQMAMTMVGQCTNEIHITDNVPNIEPTANTTMVGQFNRGGANLQQSISRKFTMINATDFWGFARNRNLQSDYSVISNNFNRQLYSGCFSPTKRNICFVFNKTNSSDVIKLTDINVRIYKNS